MGGKLGSILWIVDDRLSRERGQILMRSINALRQEYEITLLPGAISEEDVIKKLSEQVFQLVLAPWYLYFKWNKVEAFYGLTRTTGPTFAGYFSDITSYAELKNTPQNYLRMILLDLANLSTNESVLLIKSLAHDQNRSGLKPLLMPQTPIYTETWFLGQNFENRIDTVLGLPEIASTDWKLRAQNIRICLLACWSFIYDDGKSEFAQPQSSKTPKACFQLAVDKRILLMRLCTNLSSFSPKEAIRKFWLGGEPPSSASQLITQHADFIRVHPISENGDLEITLGFFTSAPAEKNPELFRSFWVEPLNPQTVSEIPFEEPGPQNPLLRPFLNKTLASPLGQSNEEQDAKAKERFIFNAAIQIRDLKKLITEKDELIRELKTGGVGAPIPFLPSDPSDLLEAFQERYLEAHEQIKNLEHQIKTAQQNGAKPEVLESLNVKIISLIQKETLWIKQLHSALELLKAVKKTGTEG